jgi:predicted translin family RNA/ssDNA-binding protein
MKQFNFKRIQKLKKSLEADRVVLDAKSDEARRQAKLAIFALQRQEGPKAKDCLKQSRDLIRASLFLVKKRPLLSGESSWKSALEEFTEAHLFETYLHGHLSVPAEAENHPDVVLGAMSDLAGEIARYSILRATERDKKAIEDAHKIVLKIVDMLAALDLTGSLRSKFDQTKQHLRKIEDIRYDLSKKD